MKKSNIKFVGSLCVQAGANQFSGWCCWKVNTHYVWAFVSNDSSGDFGCRWDVDIYDSTVGGVIFIVYEQEGRPYNPDLLLWKWSETGLWPEDYGASWLAFSSRHEVFKATRGL